MDVFRRVSHYLPKIFNKERPQKHEPIREISRFDVYLEYIYRILSWEDYSATLSVFLVLNFLFWVIVQWQLRFLGVIFLSSLVFFVYDMYFETKQHAEYVGKYTEALDDFYNSCIDVYLNLKTLRKDSPSSFCLAMCLTFLTLSLIARSISGYFLLYLTLLGIFFIPLGATLLPDEYQNILKRFFLAIGSNKGVLAEDELIPFISDKDFNKKDSELDSLLTDKTADSIPNSFISGISSMPSYLDVDDSKDEIQEEDLIPDVKDGVSLTPGDLSSDSDSDHKGINFELAHYNGDSSSEEENNLGRGLRFTPETNEILDTSKTTQNQEGLGTILSNVAWLGSSLVANVLKSAVSNASLPRKNSSSDSDFEIIDSDEFDDKS